MVRLEGDLENICIYLNGVAMCYVYVKLECVCVCSKRAENTRLEDVMCHWTTRGFRSRLPLHHRTVLLSCVFIIQHRWKGTRHI